MPDASVLTAFYSVGLLDVLLKYACGGLPSVSFLLFQRYKYKRLKKSRLRERSVYTEA